MEIEDRRRLRTAFMNWAYDAASGSEWTPVEGAQFTAPSGWTGPTPTDKDVNDAIHYLEGEGLLKAVWTYGDEPPSIDLQHAGIREVEQARQAPSEATEHFVPLVNITTIGAIHGGAQIQQGSAGATQIGQFTVHQRTDVEAFVSAARHLVERVGDGDEREQAGGDLDVMERELRRPEPRFSLLRELANSVRADLVKTLGAAAAAGVTSLPWP